MDYCGAPDASSQWPLLHVGFFGNIDRDACARASLVFDASGRFSGMLVGEQWVSSAAIDMPVSNEAARRLNADEFYESAMRIAVTLTGV